MSREPVAAYVAAAIALAAVHVLSGRLRFLNRIPRSRWLSVAGGMSVAYVFAYLLPELAKGQQTVEGDVGPGETPFLPFLEDHVYLLALFGLALFYGIEKHSRMSRHQRREGDGDAATGAGAFWLSIGSFTVYNAIIGYLLVDGELRTLDALVLYTVALGVHFVINDGGLREHHKQVYHRVGRWLVAGAVLAGLALGLATEVPERAIALLLAFVAGGVILNVLKEELPSEQRAQFVPFLLGAALYTVLLQFV